MSLVSTASVILLLFSLSLAKPVWDEPSFCHGLDCPKYTTVASRNGYEVRQYEASKWVGTTITSDDWDKAVNAGFRKLFDYIEGANQDNIKIPMASPVATKIVPLGGNSYNYSILFFVPFAYQSNTSIPTDPSLGIVNLPAITAYVRSFGGREDDRQLEDELNDLEKDLARDSTDYVKEFYFTAGYDPPFRLIGRHNEVWLLATS